MGLDVYLYRYEDFEASKRLEEEADAFENAAWDEAYRTNDIDSTVAGAYDLLPDEAKEAVRSKIAEWQKAHGLDDCGDDEVRKQQIEIDSRTRPDHYFKIGYFRSSYNDGGIERVIANAIGKSPLHWTFFGDGERGDYAFRPDWQACLIRARAVRDEYAAFAKRAGGVRIMRVAANPFMGAPSITDERKAMDAFVKEKERRDEARGKFPREGKTDWYSNATGEFFFGEPLKVLAVFAGSEEGFMSRMRGGGATPCMYIAWQSESEDGRDWYLDALDIVIETIEYVLAQPDPQKFYLHWSG